jgi:PAS domain S-box-containing protein
MDISKDIFQIFNFDDNFQEIMRRLLEASIAESFNSIIITEAAEGYPIVYANASFSEMTGYRPDEVIGKSPSILQGPATNQAVLKRLSEDISAGRVFHGRAVNYRKNGQPFIMEWKIVPIRNADRHISHYMAIQREIGESGAAPRLYDPAMALRVPG